MAASCTRHVGVEVLKYHDDMRAVHEFRGNRTKQQWSESELKSRLTTLLKYVKILPAPLAQGWLANFVKEAKGQCKWESYMTCINPIHAARTFQPRAAQGFRFSEGAKVHVLDTQE